MSGPLLIPRPFSRAPDLVQHKMVLQLDGRQTVEEAMRAIMNEWMGHLVGELPLRGTTVELSNLQRYGAGFSCLPVLSRNAVLEEAVGREMTVLLWNGATVDGNAVPVGDAGECGLLQFSVSLLQPPPEAESDGGGAGGQFGQAHGQVFPASGDISDGQFYHLGLTAGCGISLRSRKKSDPGVSTRREAPEAKASR